MRETTRADDVLSAATKRFSSRGYHGISFRDLAKDVGITSASVHYHFPTKSDLISSIAIASAERLALARDEIESNPVLSPSDKIGEFCDRFMETEDGNGHCKCIVTALVNADSIPEQVADSFRSVVNDQILWLEKMCDDIPGMENSKRHARMLMSRMMGQCLLSSCFEEYESHRSDVVSLPIRGQA